MEIMMSSSDDNLIWLDMEMSGLNTETDKVLEIATVVTDPHLNIIADIAPNKSPMCGNSICQDRRFMAKHMPNLESYFHYRNLDVSVFKELSRRWRPTLYQGFKKTSKHEALSDIYDSIDELKYYREHFLKLS